MIEADNLFDIFDHYQTDCVMELMFMATKKSHWRRGIGKKLCEESIKLGQTLVNDHKMVKVAVDDNIILDLEPIPKIVMAFFTTFKTQKIGKKMGFERLTEVPFSKFSFYRDCPLSHDNELCSTITLDALQL